MLTLDSLTRWITTNASLSASMLNPVILEIGRCHFCRNRKDEIWTNFRRHCTLDRHFLVPYLCLSVSLLGMLVQRGRGQAAGSLMTRRSPLRPSWCGDECGEGGQHATAKGPERDTKTEKAFLARRDDKIRYSYVMEWHFNYTNGRTKC